MQSPSLVLLSNQQALERSMDIVANNVANASTTGFKRENVEFDTFLSQPKPNKGINFVVDRATYRDPSTGPITPTGNPLDIAIQGPGYFTVQAPDGSIHYTRAGAFQVNTQGQIATLSGDLVLNDGNQAITVPDTTTDINVGADGFVTVRSDNGVNLFELGKIGVVKFDNEQAMKSEGNGLYTTNQVSTPAQESPIVQGALEASNVQPVSEMSQMIKIMRAYEQTCNLISQENTRLTGAINSLSKTTA